MKKIQTPISSSIGNQEMKICARKRLLFLGLGLDLDAVLDQVADHPDVARAVGDEALLVAVDIHLIVRPSTVADSTLPFLADSMNSE